MNIGLIVPGFSSTEEEWAIPALQTLVRELASAHHVRVIALRYPPTRPPYSIHGATVIPIGGGQRAGWARIPIWTRGLASILSEHRRDHFDILHGFWADEPGFLAALAGRLAGVPSVVSVMGGELAEFDDLDYGGGRSLANRSLARLALGSTDLVTGGSKFIQRTVQRVIPGRTLALLPLGVDTSLFRPQAQPLGRTDTRSPDSLRLVCAASLTGIKGHASLIDSLAATAREIPSVRLTLLGDGPLRPDLERLAVVRGISSRVEFAGHVRHDLLPGYYQGGDLYVQSSLYESQGMAVLEAAACGLPAVGSAVGILPELAESAIAVPVGDPAGMARAIARLAQDTSLRRRMAEKAVQAVAGGYSLSIYLKRLGEIYSDLIRRKTP